jgi:hypothetical protein
MKAVALLAIAMVSVEGHGYLSQPRSRNLVASDKLMFYSAPDLISRDVPGLEDYAHLGFPQSNPGGPGFGQGVPSNPCGVFNNETDFGQPRPEWYGEIVAEYAEGATIDVDIVLTVQHWGVHSWRLCPLVTDTTVAGDEECFKENVLRTADGRDWFDVTSGRQSLVLPPGFTCEHCLLSWRWDSLYTNEIYTNCADIQIGSGPWDPPTPPTPTTPPVTPPPSATAPPTTASTPPPTVAEECLPAWTECTDGGASCCAGTECWGSASWKQCTPR